MSGVSLGLGIVIGIALLGGLVAMIIGMVRGGRFSRDPSSPPESAAQTWRTAVPWLIGIAAVMLLVLGAYWITG